MREAFPQANNFHGFKPLATTTPRNKRVRFVGVVP